MNTKLKTKTNRIQPTKCTVLKYTEDEFMALVPAIIEWLTDNLPIKEVANNLGLSSRTSYYEYLARYPEASKQITMALEMRIEEVEAALFRAAVGFQAEEITVRKEKTVRGEKEIIATTQRSIPPNVKAAIFILERLNKKVYGKNASGVDKMIIELVDAVRGEDNSTQTFYTDENGELIERRPPF